MRAILTLGLALTVTLAACPSRGLTQPNTSSPGNPTTVTGGPGVSLQGCPMFPADHILNTPVDTLPVDKNSSAYINSIGATRSLHPDFGTVYEGAPIGIPYTSVPANQPGVPVSFEYADESDPGPYPIPANAPIEGGANSSGDRHVLIMQQGTCKLYELFAAYPQANGWQAGSGAVWDLRSNALRPDTWTSSDAAGLPVLPLLVRYDEVMAGEIRHAIRFAAARTRKAYVWPARHQAGASNDASLPPMGQRFRLKASFNTTGFSKTMQVILKAMKTYGLILADNGSNWYVIGAHDPRWNDEELVLGFNKIKGSDFEAVDVSGLMIDPNSGQARVK